MLKSRKKKDEPQPADPAVTATAAHADPLADQKAKAEAHLNRVKANQAEASKANAECGPIPQPTDPSRRELFRFDLQGFSDTYLSQMFVDKKGRHKPWADFHIEMFQIAQETILEGGEFVEALPRGSGKTAVIAAAIIWAACYGHRKFGVGVSGTDGKASDLLELIKVQFEVAALLAADFPEICVPVRHLERKTQKCKTQTVDGVQTRIEWNENEIVLPTVAGSEASGFRFKSVGLTGSGIRGLLAPNADGNLLRPDIILIDDPQTDDSARSPVQCGIRLRLIDTVLGMAGPGESMAVFACVTVIFAGDLADMLLSNPDWSSIRYGILTKLPSKEQFELWDKYREIQLDAKKRRLGRDPEITFYRDNQPLMDGDLKATWPARFNPATEITGIQAAMNLYYRFPITFRGEYMNDPESPDGAEVFELDPALVRERINHYPRHMVPMGYEFITVGVDVQETLIWYVVVAWKMDLTGAVIDYGWLPKQPGRDFNLSQLHKTLQSESGAAKTDLDAAVSWGLMELGTYLFVGRKWQNQRGFELHAVNGQVDINFRECQDAVARFCGNSPWKHIFTPAMGQGRNDSKGGRKTRISRWKHHPGQNWPKDEDLLQCQWMETNPRESHGQRERYFDADHWKTWVNSALTLPLHSSGSLSFYGEDAGEHLLLSKHLTSHYPEPDEDFGIKITHWELRTGFRDDLLDCLVGAAVAASRHGARLTRVHTALPRVEESNAGAYPEHMVKSKGWTTL